MSMETTLPFSGFYNSLWSDELDRCEEMQIQYWEEGGEYPGVDAADMRDALIDHIDYRAACIDVAKAYVDAFENWINEEAGTSVTLTFDELTSPREYNFTTDRIFAKLILDDVVQIYRAVGKAAVREMAKARFTSCSGFISFYNPDIDTWGSLRSWDCNQIGTIFEAAVKKFDTRRDIDITLLDMLNENIYKAWSDNLDWDAVEKDLKERQIEAEDGIEDDRKFPCGVGTVAQYVQKFEELNHLKGEQ